MTSPSWALLKINLLPSLDNLGRIKHAPEPTPTNGALSPRGLREPPNRGSIPQLPNYTANGPRQQPLFGDAGNNMEHGAEPQRHGRRVLCVAAMAARSWAWGCRHPSACPSKS
ncbi:hypothetical protein CYMTET_7014 [Cymbomonas tetramitiformis]|uniref:Uncharacterized protein n=1 Tax=Cymbomonas tetramitiformis TaxID=36881 RepID=A0AAE0LHV3_9CHLO|nr:hypothetical protein CYMTET_7014 [Cymbomonas tetramitiformis]